MDEQKPMSSDDIRKAVDAAVAANENVAPRPLTKKPSKGK